MLSAQRLADEAVENAKSKAEAIVKEAEEKAGQIVDDAQAEKTALSGELETLRKNAADYKDGLLALLNKHKSMLENDSFFKKQ